VSEAPFLSTAFGLRIWSNRLVPGLRPQTEPDASLPDIRVWLGEFPPGAILNHDVATLARYTSPRTDPSGRPLLVVSETDDGFTRFQYADGVDFLLDPPARRVWASWSGETTLDDAAVYLLGPILGYALRKRGVTCLHASVVAADGMAFALVGSAQTGKSTTAAAFARQRFPVLSDDIAALCEIDGRLHVRPAYPQLRLWPDSAERLFGSREALERLTPQSPRWDKRFLSLATDEHPFVDQPLPLAAVYILSTREASDLAPRIEPLAARDRLLELISNTYTSYLATFADQRRELALLSGLAASIPVRRAIPHSNPDRLTDLCSTILTDLADVCAANAMNGATVRSLT
jgi:hypothetical protein